MKFPTSLMIASALIVASVAVTPKANAQESYNNSYNTQSSREQIENINQPQRGCIWILYRCY